MARPLITISGIEQIEGLKEINDKLDKLIKLLSPTTLNAGRMLSIFQRPFFVVGDVVGCEDHPYPMRVDKIRGGYIHECIYYDMAGDRRINEYITSDLNHWMGKKV